MFGFGFTYLLNALCALSDTICLPLNHAVVPEPSTRHLDKLRIQQPEVWGYRVPIAETKLGLIEGYEIGRASCRERV